MLLRGKRKRKSQYFMIDVVWKDLTPKFSLVWKDLTPKFSYDNGSENVLHEAINKKLRIQSFFCEPYNSWEKGSVEQVNGLIRRFFPKGTDFSKVTVSEINRVEKLLNNRPRKCLNYQTPYEVFRNACGALTA